MASLGRCLRVGRPFTASVIAKQVSRTVACQPKIQLDARQFSSTSQYLVRKYTKDHEWIDLKGDGKHATIGISQYAADQLGDVVYVELPTDGLKVKKGDPMGAIESVKSAADINAPISCQVKDVNLLLEEKPGTVNKVPEDDSPGGGWFAKVILDEDINNELEDLMDAEEYQAFVTSEEH